MNTTKTVLILSFYLLATCLSGQVNFLENPDWNEAKKLSVQSGKPIFIDVYTTWCGPCKRMSKTTFQDPSLGKLMNENFINLKIDAEKSAYSELIQQYQVNSYPTLLFTNSNGDMISKEIGFKSTDQLESICNNLMVFLDEGITTPESGEYDLSDSGIDNFLENYSNFESDYKEKIKSKLYDNLENNLAITPKAFGFLIKNADINDNYSLLSDNIPANGSTFDNAEWEYGLHKIYMDAYKNAIQKGDLSAFNKIATNHTKASKGPLKAFSKFQNPNKESRTHKLDFYLTNAHYPEYFHLADTLVTEYILPLNYEAVKSNDELRMKFLSTPPSIDIPADTTALPLRDSLLIKHSTSINITRRLNGLAENTLKHLNEDEHMSQSLEWIDLSIKYLDLPESRIIRATILERTGRHEESLQELELAKKSIYFDKSCETKIEELGLQ